jgi:hypothetical protein
MKLNTDDLIYVCTDSSNADVKILFPKRLLEWMTQNGIDIATLDLSNPDPESTDAAEYKLLSGEMEEFRFDV